MSQTESVKFLIDAEDRATAKIRKVTEQIEGQVTQVQQVGSKAKASAELVGSLANSLGNTGVGGFAGEIAGLTEKVSAFGEVAKSGGAAALAFKGALIGGVAVGAFKAGEALGNLIFQTEKWKEKLEAANAEARKLNDLQMNRRGEQFQQDQEVISLLDQLDPAAAEAAVADTLAKVERDMRAKMSHLAREKKQLADEELKFFNKGNVEAAKLAVEMREQEIAQLRAQQKELQSINSEHANKVDSLKQQITDLNFIKGLETQLENSGKSQLELAREKANAIQDQAAKARALAAVQGLENLQQQQAAEDKLKKAVAEQRREQERIAKLQKDITNDIQLQMLELTQGPEAAEQMRLQMQGLSESQAASVVQFRTLMEQYKENARIALDDTAKLNDLNGSDERLLSGRVTANTAQVDRTQQQQAAEQQKRELINITENLKYQTNQMVPLLEQIANNIGVEVREVSL